MFSVPISSGRIAEAVAAVGAFALIEEAKEYRFTPADRLRVEHNRSGMTSRAALTAFEVLMQKSNPSSANTQIHAKKLHA